MDRIVDCLGACHTICTSSRSMHISFTAHTKELATIKQSVKVATNTQQSAEQP